MRDNYVKKNTRNKRNKKSLPSLEGFNTLKNNLEFIR
jgi:hypothetical protein